MPTIRPAREADIPAILALHNHHILNSLAIWRYEPADLDERLGWFRERTQKGFPILVADLPSAEVAGFATYGPFRTGAGYDGTVENSIYVRDDVQRRGVAAALMEALIAEARRDGRAVMVAAIGLPNDPSRALHTRFGFREVGCLEGIGRKFGRALDLLMMQKDL
ncbi:MULTISPECIES: GNAT family N-acetyltransferase [Chelatococcus]|uniref:Phosphinothricin acetyltransferase n=1 Tax=Chelatococcus caeni TaxID=1348468 RepID=A0A840C0I9_9HYPH|nr:MULTISPECIES: GNAT family N-acetyltransferase [Chelatococcus]ALA17080.1 hypothetical protein AL346_06270 [Chelatococcus sp. CO-6]MBB4017178.1 phosphinothricin acetyltransferase [Chelatococcus caeni]